MKLSYTKLKIILILVVTEAHEKRKDTIVMKERIGLIDIGSNSIRLVVFQVEDNLAMREIQNIKIPARIFQYINDNHEMSQEGIDTLARIIGAFAKEAAILKADRILPKATAAIRQSANKDDIINQVKKKTGVTIELVPEEMEAYYGFSAVVHSMSDSDGVSIDIGGGSTEITVFKDKELVEAFSFPFGAVSLQEKFFNGKDFNDAKSIKETRKYVRQVFSEQPFFENLNLPIFAIGGSARNVARVHQMQSNYGMAGLHEYTMKPKEIDQVFDTFVDLSMKDMLKLEGLSSNRADIIVPATIVFQELIQTVDSPVFKFSQQGLREGIVYEYLEEKYRSAFDIHQVAQQTVERLSSIYQFSIPDSAQRMVIARQLYAALSEDGYLKLNDRELELMNYGAYLYNLGEMIEPGNASQHTFYLLSNSNLNGFSHPERLALSILASYKNKTLFDQYLTTYGEMLDDKQVETLQHIGGLIKFAECLNDSHNNIVKSMDTVMKGNSLILRIFYQGELLSEVYRSEDQKKHVERAIGKDITLEFINANSYRAIL